MFPDNATTQVLWTWCMGKRLHSANCNGSSRIYMYRSLCRDWTEMKSSRRVAVRPAVQIGKTQRSSFMCIHVDDDDCEHGSAKQYVTLLSALFLSSHRLRAGINNLIYFSCMQIVNENFCTLTILSFHASEFLVLLFLFFICSFIYAWLIRINLSQLVIDLTLSSVSR